MQYKNKTLLVVWLLLYTTSLFALTIDAHYVLEEKTLSPLIESRQIYDYIEKNPKLAILPKASLFSLPSNIIAKKQSVYNMLAISKTQKEDYIYIAIPISLMAQEMSISEYKVKHQSSSFVLRFKKLFTKDALVYLELDIGDKKKFSIRILDEEASHFAKHHASLLFDREDLSDFLRVTGNFIYFTSNYPKNQIALNTALSEYLTLKKQVDSYTLNSKNIYKTYTLLIDPALPKLECNQETLLNEIVIDDESFTLGAPITTSQIYAMHLLDKEDLFNDFLTGISLARFRSRKSNNQITLSYSYSTFNVRINLNLPPFLAEEIKYSYLSSFSSFDFRINDVLFEGYQDNTSVYPVQKNICLKESAGRIQSVINTKNFSEFSKWDLEVDRQTNTITFTPLFKIAKISPIIHAPFLLKKQNKYITDTQIDAESKMDGEVKYAYTHDNIRFQDRTIINERTNTNLYFKYPTNANLTKILEKTTFIYNSNEVSPVYISDTELKFATKKANKLALIYYPTGNLESFRQYFTRYFDCNLPQNLDEEICFNYLFDMEDGMEGFLENLRRSKDYTQILYRKHHYSEKDKENLILYNQSNKKYAQATEDQVLGEAHDLYRWSMGEALQYDKTILNTYGLSNIDLIYFANIDLNDRQKLEQLNNAGFNRVFLVNFGNKSKKLENLDKIRLIEHKYNQKMQSSAQEFDISAFDEIYKQITLHQGK